MIWFSLMFGNFFNIIDCGCLYNSVWLSICESSGLVDILEIYTYQYIKENCNIFITNSGWLLLTVTSSLEHYVRAVHVRAVMNVFYGHTLKYRKLTIFSTLIIFIVILDCLHSMVYFELHWILTEIMYKIWKNKRYTFETVGNNRYRLMTCFF